MQEPIFKPEKETGFSLSALLVAGQFLTTMPPVLKRPFTSQELGQSVAFFPLIGLILGLILAAANYGLAFLFPVTVRAVLLLVLWVLLTGVLHLDGFLDACDGLFGGFTPEKRLHIMRDEAVGAYALAGGVLLILLKYTALTAVPQQTIPLILAPTLGRWAIALSLVRYPYARKEGLGRTMKDMASHRELIIATATAVLVALFIGGWLGLIALLMVLLIVLLGARFVMRRIPGMTGDIYGMMCELSETAVLLIFVAGATLWS